MLHNYPTIAWRNLTARSFFGHLPRGPVRGVGRFMLIGRWVCDKP
jgi:hypothetical protein